MNRLFKISILTTVLGMATNALAVGQGFYVAAELGGNRLFQTGTAPDDQFSWGGVMGYNFRVASRFLLAPEVGVHSLGNPRVAFPGADGSLVGVTRMRTTGYQFLGAATYNATNKMDVFFKAGLAAQGLRAPAAVHVHGSAATHMTDWGPMIAAGVGYDITPHVQTYLQWNQTFSTDTSPSSTSVMNAVAVYAGLKYSFGK
jgi:hypothetical protein